MLIVSNSKWSRIISGSAALTLALGVVAQGLATAQAEPYGYIQADCPNIVKQAFDTVGAQCSKIARGKMCYGNSTITAEYQPGVNNVQFSAPGDTVDVTALKRFTLGRMDTTANSWGVAELKIKADLPDTDPSQAVTMILFGGVQLTDASAAVQTQTAGNAAQLNQELTATRVAGNQAATKSAATGTKIVALENTATARAKTPTATGTISASKATQGAATVTKLANIINTATAVSILPTAEPEVRPVSIYSAAQAFYFQSGDTAPCDQAPHDGLLIQSPHAPKQRVKLVIDDATISIGSTIYITAQAGKFLTINVIEGHVTVVAQGQSNSADFGTVIQIPLDNNLHASGPPVFSNFYSADAIRALPTALLPDTSVMFAAGLPAGLAFSSWSQVNTVTSGNCPSNKDQVQLAFNQSSIWFSDGLMLVRSPQGPYIGTTVSDLVLDYSVVADTPDHFGGTYSSTLNGKHCTFSISLTRNPGAGVLSQKAIG